jgi:hypothetical protein
MPSPFPGMNPYLEHRGVWHDFHESVLPVLRAQLTPQIAPRYYSQIDEQVYIHSEEGDDRKQVGRPDIGLFHDEPLTAAESAVAVLEPETVTMPAFDQLSESFLRIVDRDSGELITVIELLSPTNKTPGDDRRKYIDKRNAFVNAGVNLVEIDLLRGGPRMPAHGLLPCDYCVITMRPSLWPKAGVHRFMLSDPLPEIHIPLAAGEPEVTLNLRAALDRTYDEAGYESRIYESSPEPPLTAQQAAWARHFIPKTAARA